MMVVTVIVVMDGILVLLVMIRIVIMLVIPVRVSMSRTARPPVAMTMA